jgi:peptidoglycan/xylan/chitin deacetylase (PgdA/CDA1 family)
MKDGGPGASATVLIYHRFGEEKYPSTNVSVARFAEQLVFLKKNKYTVVPLVDLVRMLTAGRPLAEKTVAITIDDGYKSVYEKAWPVLRSFGYPFTVFLYVKATDTGHWDYMTWDQVREMRAAGVDFQDHGYAHRRFGSIPEQMSAQEYTAWIGEDFAKSSSIIERELGYRPKMLAFPYGEYNRSVIAVARDLGYTATFTQDPGAMSASTDPYRIPREPILGVDWSTLDHFAMVLERVDLPLADIVPDISVHQRETPPVFGARLLFPEHYRPGTLGIYVTALGWRQVVPKGEVVSLENDRKLERRLNRVAVSAREKQSNRTAIRFWLLVNENVAPD